MGWSEVSEKLKAMQSDFEYAGSQSPPKAADIDAVEQRLGVRFPAEYREMVGRFAAFTVEAKEEHWPVPKLYDVGPAWTFTRGFALLAFGDGVPEFLDVERETEELRTKTGTDLVPFFRVSASADRTCFTRDGRIMEWRHDEEGVHASQHATVYDVLQSHLEELEENMAEMKRMRASAKASAKKRSTPLAKSTAKKSSKKSAKKRARSKAAPAAKKSKRKNATKTKASAKRKK